MHDAVVAGVPKGTSALLEQLANLFGRQRAALRKLVPQRLALQQLHRKEDDVPALPDAVDRNDVGMFELGRRASFSLEPLYELLVVRECKRENLERDIAVERPFPGTIHGGHPAVTQLSVDLVVVL